MNWLFQLLSDIGTAGIDFFWLPVGIWTIIAMMGAGMLNLFEDNIPTIYQYHSRVALLWSLAAGMFGSALVYVVSLSSVGSAGIPAKFIIIQSPVSFPAATTTASAASVNGWTPELWVGLLTASILLPALGGLTKLIVDFASLKLFSEETGFSASDLTTEISKSNLRLLHQKNNIIICFSDEVAVPFTFGWKKRTVILPAYFRDDSDKLNMALRHELIHITNHDYLVNGTVKGIKALFCFHPLVHLLTARIEEYRELYCDQQVLQDASITPKKYAGLLFELSPQPLFKQSAAVKMAVRPSTLKKRIQAMKNTTQPTPSLKWSVSIMLVAALMITGLMACSDLQNNGITSSKVEDMQTKRIQAIDMTEALYIINGKVKETDGNTNLLKRIKRKYIESIEVLEGKKAIEEYGKKAKNGVIKLKVAEKAFNDLQKAPVAPKRPTKPFKFNGKAKLNADQPLYIIDGEIVNFNKSDTPLPRLEPTNIKSIEVLKDESAIDAYGEKAANGAVIITTKDTKGGQTLGTIQESKTENLKNAAAVAIVKAQNSSKSKGVILKVKLVPTKLNVDLKHEEK